MHFIEKCNAEIWKELERTTETSTGHKFTIIGAF